MLKLKPDPTFTAPVEIPVPGSSPERIKVEFRYRMKDEFEEWLKDASDRKRTDADCLPEIMVAWHEVDQPFSPESLAQLCQAYPGAAAAIADKYIAEQRGGAPKAGN